MHGRTSETRFLAAWHTRRVFKGRARVMILTLACALHTLSYLLRSGAPRVTFMMQENKQSHTTRSRIPLGRASLILFVYIWVMNLNTAYV